VQQTGNPLDVAVSGNAFLTVQTPRGERYTRNGALQINSQGQLVTSEGLQVIGQNGPIVFQPNDRDISIGIDGIISVREGQNTTDSQRGKLKLATFNRPQQLSRRRRPRPTRARRRHAAGADRRTRQSGRDREVERQQRDGNDAHGRSDATTRKSPHAAEPERHAPVGDRELAEVPERLSGTPGA
jgi:hypothetical protein